MSQVLVEKTFHSLVNISLNMHGARAVQAGETKYACRLDRWARSLAKECSPKEIWLVELGKLPGNVAQISQNW